MRGGKRGSQRGKERVFAENEEDIIARNMMVVPLYKFNNRVEAMVETDEVIMIILLMQMKVIQSLRCLVVEDV